MTEKDLGGLSKDPAIVRIRIVEYVSRVVEQPNPDTDYDKPVVKRLALVRR